MIKLGPSTETGMDTETADLAPLDTRFQTEVRTLPAGQEPPSSTERARGPWMWRQRVGGLLVAAACAADAAWHVLQALAAEYAAAADALLTADKAAIASDQAKLAELQAPTVVGQQALVAAGQAQLAKDQAQLATDRVNAAAMQSAVSRVKAGQEVTISVPGRDGHGHHGGHNLLMLAACSGKPASTPAPTPTSAPSKTGIAWLLTRSALSQLVTDPAVRGRLRHSQICEILRAGQQPLAGVTAKPVVTFASATALQDAVKRDQIPAGLSTNPAGRRSAASTYPAPSRPRARWSTATGSTFRAADRAARFVTPRSRTSPGQRSSASFNPGVLAAHRRAGSARTPWSKAL
jgi:hypothetical protein